MLGSLIAALLMRIHAQGILQRTMKGMQDRINALDTELARQQATADARLEAASTLTLKLHGELRDLTLDGSALRNERDEARLALRDSMAENRSLSEKLDTQKKETMELHQQSATTFENLANRIFEQKSEKFSELNKTQMKEMLEPLGKNISEFKAKVEEVYHHESKERFSLGERVKELAKLN
jgi:DNA recombination protein RmuC